MFFTLQDSKTEKVTDLTVNVSEYVDEANLQTFERFVNLFVFIEGNMLQNLLYNRMQLL